MVDVEGDGAAGVGGGICVGKDSSIRCISQEMPKRENKKGNRLERVSSSCRILPRYRMRRNEGAGGRSSDHSTYAHNKSVQYESVYRVNDVRALTIRPRIPHELLDSSDRCFGVKGHAPPTPGDEQEGQTDLRRLRHFGLVHLIVRFSVRNGRGSSRRWLCYPCVSICISVYEDVDVGGGVTRKVRRSRIGAHARSVGACTCKVDARIGGTSGCTEGVESVWRGMEKSVLVRCSLGTRMRGRKIGRRAKTA